MYLKLRFYLFIPGRQYFVVVRDGCCYVFDNDQSTQPKVAFSLENYCRYEKLLLVGILRTLLQKCSVELLKKPNSSC